MALVPASVTFGFDGSAAYLLLDDAAGSHRDAFKQKVADDMEDRFQNCVAEQISALSVALDVDDDHGSATDDEVGTLIDEQLDAMSQASGTTFERAGLHAIRYIWHGDDRYCQHSYAVTIDGTAWQVAHDDTTGSEQILVILEW